MTFVAKVFALRSLIGIHCDEDGEPRIWTSSVTAHLPLPKQVDALPAERCGPGWRRRVRACGATMCVLELLSS